MRYIGIRHRTKKTAEQESRPTQLVILAGEEVTTLELATETDELDFVRGQFPVVHRPLEEGENISSYPLHHLKWRKRTAVDDDPSIIPTHWRKIDSQYQVATKCPARYAGLQKDDHVAMILGGSGDCLAYALTRRGQQVGALVHRIPTFAFKQRRKSENKEDDAGLLASLLKSMPELFTITTPADLATISVREALRARTEALQARIACEQRIRTSLIGKIFCHPEGLYPEGEVEKLYDEAKANDPILAVLLKEEAARNRDLAKAVESLDVYDKIFKPITGVGPAISARIIAAIGDIRRFETAPKLKAFCGVHVLADGRFPRRRGGEVANWHPDARQALYLLADQFNRRPDSDWGRKLLAYKQKLRLAHPEVIEVDGKKRYTNGHIHKMAQWRTLSKFVEWLFREWKKLEENQLGENEQQRQIA
ncbi:MAG: transposase [Patescibacteria group bacterium]